jgi:POT family proton-dependent oligopeptide transporter
MEHPKSIYMLSSTAMLESFSYYIFAGLLVMYMIDVLHFTNPFSTYIFGIAYGSTYILQILGGYVCDRYLGNRKAIIFGISFIVIAQLIFAYDASLFSLSTNVPAHSALLFTYPEIIFLIGIAFMAIGVSFFKVNIASFINLFYKEDSKLLDSAFSIFYLFLNIGGFLAPLLINLVVGVHHPSLYQYGFLIGFLAIFIGLVLFLTLKNKFFVLPNGEPVGVKPRYETETKKNEKKGIKLSKTEISRLKVIFLVLISVLVFQVFTQQIFTSMILFAESHINNTIPFINHKVAPSIYLTLNPLFIIILSPIYIRISQSLSSKNKEPSSITKIGIGLLIAGVAYLVLFVAMYHLGSDMKISMVWLVLFNFFLENSELLIMPVTLSVITKLAPERITSSIIGVYYVTFSIASMIAGLCASAFPNLHSTMLFHVIPIPDLSTYFLLFAVIGFAVGGIWLLLKNRMIKMAQENI